MSENIVTFRLNDQLSEPPLNVGDLEFEITPDPSNIDAQPLVNLGTVDFESIESVALIYTWIKDGYINEGLPITADIDDGGTTGPFVIIDGYLVLNAPGVLFFCDRIENIPIEPRGQIDSFSRNAERATFKIMLDAGAFTTKEYIFIPYVISDLPDYKGAAIVAITAFIVFDKIASMLKEILKVIADLAGVLSAIAGVLKIIVLILWIVLTLIALIVFMFQVLDQLIQPVKYHAAMNLKRLFEIGFDYLGWKFESTLFDSELMRDMVVCPAKPSPAINEKKLLSFGSPFPDVTESTGYPQGDFLAFVQKWKEYLNAGITFTSDRRVIFEELGYKTKQPAYKMDKNVLIEGYSTNSDDIIGAITVAFLTDSADKNTLYNYEGTRSIITTKVKRANNEENVLIHGKKTIQFDYAKARIKKELSGPEKLADRLVKNHLAPINKLISIANVVIVLQGAYITKIMRILGPLDTIGIKIPFNPKVVAPIDPITSDQIEKRKGTMLLSEDIFTVDKLLTIDQATSARNTNLKSINESQVHSEFWWNTFLRGLSHVPSERFPSGNQRKIYSANGLELCKEDYRLLNDNPIIFTPDEEQAELISINSIISNGIARNSYSVLDDDPNTNLVETIETPLGR